VLSEWKVAANGAVEGEDDLADHFQSKYTARDNNLQARHGGTW
jgi:hypothetical protein